MPVGYLPIYNSIKSFCEHLHGVSIINGQVRIFARLNGTNPIRYAADFAGLQVIASSACSTPSPSLAAKPAQIGKYWIRVTGWSVVMAISTPASCKIPVS